MKESGLAPTYAAHAAPQMNQAVKAKIRIRATVATIPPVRASDLGGLGGVSLFAEGGDIRRALC